MATANHVLLRRITLSVAASSVVFDSIPQTGYTDLKLVASTRSDSGNVHDYPSIRFNSDTSGSTAYTKRHLRGNGAAAESGTESGTAQFAAQMGVGGTATSNTFSNTEFYIPNYTSSNYKSVVIDSVGENNATTAYTGLNAGLYSSNSAISTITVFPFSGPNWVAGSSFSLYGIADVNTTPKSSPKAFGGDIVKSDGTYWYHAFLASGSFTPQVNLTADVLVVAGGGGGGRCNGGGGGAGGILGFTSQSLTSLTGYTCTVGSGGAGGTSTNAAASSGGDSRFAALTLVKGGGGGAGGSAGNGSNGGSGGGGGGIGGGSGGTGTSGQGNDGYTGAYASQTGGGGGGSGIAASNKNGGYGIGTYSSWLSTVNVGQNISGTYYIAAGGGAGTNFQAGGEALVAGVGGNGGGGSGYNQTSLGVPAPALGNTGSGGGGSGGNGDTSNGGNGASGIIIIRYPV